MGLRVENGGPKIVKNGPRVWAFCKIEFPGIQKPVQFFGQKSGFFRNPGNRGVGVIWSGVGGVFVVLSFYFVVYWFGCGFGDDLVGRVFVVFFVLILRLLGYRGSAGIRLNTLIL